MNSVPVLTSLCIVFNRICMSFLYDTDICNDFKLMLSNSFVK